ncbi:MAG: Holliday junction resolvase RuvX [Bacteroidota bacterium]
MNIKGRILGIDYGSKRVGIAVSDPLQMLARGLSTLVNDSGLLDRIRTIVGEEGAVRVVVGMPYAPDGGLGEKAREVDRFVRDLRRMLEVSVDTWDESFSSKDARAAFQKAGMKRKKRQEKGRVDRMAASLMLQEYLDRSIPRTADRA